MKKQPVFKDYDQNQRMLLPPSLEDIIDQNHPVRIVNRVINQINLEPLYERYEGGGASSYDPKMMLKIIIYAYLSNIYSSRKIEEAVKESVHFMWLSAMNFPDHNSINRFRSERLKSILKELFAEIVKLLQREGLLSIKDVYTDGTKIEANANRYTFVWGKSIKSRKKKIAKQIEQLWRYAEDVTKRELSDTKPTSYEEINPEKVMEAVETINKSLEGKKIDKKTRRKLNRMKKKWPEQLNRYQEQEEKLNGRNSYSKTDEDATFMRMKEDRLGNGELKAAYNLQISTNNQFILNYSLHQSAGDTTTFKDHFEEFFNIYEQMPEAATLDGGYGSEENYEFAEENNIDAYIKYSGFDKENKDKYKKDISSYRNLYYNEEKDCFYCPMGQQMLNIDEYTEKTKTGYEKTIKKYQATNCKGCPIKSSCHKGKGNRIIQIDHNAMRHKAKAKKLLNSKEGRKKRRRRPIEPEAVFGNIKQNKKFKRFLLRGLEKVKIEIGLLSISYNLSKMALKVA